jgi:hypothetical protein
LTGPLLKGLQIRLIFMVAFLLLYALVTLLLVVGKSPGLELSFAPIQKNGGRDTPSESMIQVYTSVTRGGNNSERASDGM